MPHTGKKNKKDEEEAQDKLLLLPNSSQ